jgi:hypothetical protein
MDGQRFDAVTRLLAGGLRRRDALKTLAGVAVAGVATRAVIDDARACSPQFEYCEKRTDCCAGLGCDKVDRQCVTCRGHNESCNGDNDCCSGLTCNKHKKCTEGNGGGKVKCNGKDCKKKKKHREGEGHHHE